MNLDSTVIAAIITAFATLFASLLSILLSPPSVLDGIVSLKQKLFSGYTVKITSLTNGQRVKTKKYFMVRGSITGKLPNNTELFLLQ